MAINTRQELVDGLKNAIQGKTLKSTAMLYLYNLIFLIFLSFPLTLIFGGDKVRRIAPYLVASLIIGEYVFCWFPFQRKIIKKKSKSLPDPASFFQKTITTPDTVLRGLSALIVIVLIGTVYYMFSPDSLKIQVAVKEEPGYTQVFYKPITNISVLRPQSSIWAIIHPKGTIKYYVRRTTYINGAYTFTVRLEEFPEIDPGSPIEGMFVANSSQPLHDGDVLSSWPEAGSKSNIIELKLDR